MTRSTDPRLSVVDQWYEAYNARDVEAMCAVADPDVEVVPMGPLLTKLPGASFHGHDGLRTLAEWSYANYPPLRVESWTTRKVRGWILGSATFLVDDTQTPVVRRHTETLFAVHRQLVRTARTFLTDSQALEVAAGVPALTPREREIFQLLARGLNAPDIARELVLSPATVRTHIQNGVARLGAKSRLQALAMAVKRGEVHV
jgi:DNA-binding NarL/FixJ family response regulator